MIIWQYIYQSLKWFAAIASKISPKLYALVTVALSFIITAIQFVKDTVQDILLQIAEFVSEVPSAGDLSGLSEIIGLANTFFPVDYLFVCVLVYWNAKVVSLTIRVAKSVIPGLT